MNKFLLSCAVGALASVSAFGADFSFGYCTGDDILGNLSEGQPDTWIAAAIKIPGQEILDTYGEVTLTKVSVGLGKTPNPNIQLFLSYGPDIDPFYTQNATGVAKEFTTITLDQPYTITDKDLYLGYIVKST